MNRKQAMLYVENVENVKKIKDLLRFEISEAPKIAYESAIESAKKDLRSKSKIKRRNARKQLSKPFVDPIDIKGTWAYYASKLLAWIESGMDGKPPFSVFKENGNKKLPFYAFSSLALADCPGKGDCQNFCYSLKAWRYPAAFFRQVQNSLLMRYKWEIIDQHWNAIPADKTVRLFVDGDFPNIEILRSFLDLCKVRSDLRVYGYSKSWSEFVSLGASGYVFPNNYLVNQSSGSKWENTGIGNAFKALPIVRGRFDAVEVDKAFIQSKAYQDKANEGSSLYRKTVREKLKALHSKVFACPGNCGNCLPDGKHACGSKSFEGITIGIGIHG